MDRLRVLVVDDSPLIRKLVTRMIESDPDMIVAATARNGREAVTKYDVQRPDVVVLDVEMPVMNGLEALRGIRAIDPRAAVIMFSTLTEHGASATLQALSAGATDYVAKPARVGTGAQDAGDVQAELIAKVRTAAEASRRPRRGAPSVPEPRAQRTGELPPAKAPEAPAAAPTSAVPSTDPPRPRVPRRERAFRAIGIASSTGGPNALEEVIRNLPAHLPVPVFIVQHMPPVFTGMLARQLDDVTPLHVREAAGDEVAAPGEIWLAPGALHMEVVPHASGGKIRVFDGPREHSCRPAADVLFRSLAAVFGPSTLAVVLTGMGKDGAEGARAIRTRGGEVWAQDEATSVVWGMPGEVVRAGQADAVLPLAMIAPRVTELFARAVSAAGRWR